MKMQLLLKIKFIIVVLVMLMSLSGCMKDYDFNPATTGVRMMIQGSE